MATSRLRPIEWALLAAMVALAAVPLTGWCAPKLTAALEAARARSGV